MLRWSVDAGEDVVNTAIDAFLVDIFAAYKKHGLSISHEDCHGAFEIEQLSQANIDWLRHAHDNTNERQAPAPIVRTVPATPVSRA